MVDIESFKLLVDQQIRDGVTARNEAKLRSDEADRKHAKSQQKIADLLEEVARLRAAPADAAAPVLGDAAARAAAARAEKISKIQINLKKSNKLKEYKESTETTVKEWLSKFNTELNTLKKMAGIVGDLTREEMVDLFKDRLEYQVVKHLDPAFAAKEPQWVWADVTYDQLKAIMKVE